ncbi:MAG: hypothetical protein KDI56_09650 [Xanthomonadales bacterium]|nr:hypothetical protein [Xanthomonadales bacterium]MCB1627671.1 hypothetical protein [Xanthomonadales bacterium]
MTEPTMALQARWIPTRERVERAGFVRQFGRRRPVAIARLRVPRSAGTEPGRHAPGDSNDAHPHTLLECPCCALRAPIEEFDLVDIGGVQHHHCPSCDANLGSERRSLGYAA